MAIGPVEKHSVFIYDRGGRRRVAEIEKPSQVAWSRLRDEVSEGSVTLDASQAVRQRAQLEQVEPMRHELVIFRGDERVWEGPLTLLQSVGDQVTFGAKDVLHYANRRAMHARYSNAFPNVDSVVRRAAKILRAEMALRETENPPINVLPHLRTWEFPTDARTSRVTEAYEMYVYEHLDELAAKGGLDYTVLGRSILLWDTSRPIGQTRAVTQADFLGPLRISIYGMEFASWSISTDGEGNAGIAGNADPYYGNVELLATAYDEETADKDEAPPTVAELRSQAVRNLAGRNPVPVHVGVPENSRLNPNGVLAIGDLVPGVHIPLTVASPIRTLSQMQKLNNVKVTETSSGEEITVSMGPASASDDTGEEPA